MTTHLPESHLKIVSRSEWGAAPPEGKMSRLKLPVDTVYFTYTNTSQCSRGTGTLPSCSKIVKELQQESMYEKGLAEIPFNFLLGGDGYVYEGRGWKNKPEDIPEEPELKDKEALVIAYIGREEDKIPKYRKKNLKRVEDSFFEFGIENDYLDAEADVLYGEPSKLLAPQQEAASTTGAATAVAGESEPDGENPFDKFF